MKRLLSLGLVFFNAFLLCSCFSVQQAKVPVNFYYTMRQIEYGSETGVIAPEVREAKGHVEDYPHLLTQYLGGPKDADYISPFPAGILLEDFEIYNGIAHITLSVHLSLLSGAELTVACACISMTVMEMTGLNSVQIRSQNSLLDGKEYITMTNDCFAFLDTGADYASVP